MVIYFLVLWRSWKILKYCITCNIIRTHNHGHDSMVLETALQYKHVFHELGQNICRPDFVIYNDWMLQLNKLQYYFKRSFQRHNIYLTRTITDVCGTDIKDVDVKDTLKEGLNMIVIH